MSIRAIVALTLAAGGAGAYGVGELDKSMNYVETDAYVSQIEVDCFIKDGNSKVVEKNSGRLAYMDCKMAPLVAPIHDHDASDIQYRYQLEYTYKSPVDGSRHKKEHTVTSHSQDKYRKDQDIKIFAHKDEPAKSRWN